MKRNFWKTAMSCGLAFCLGSNLSGAEANPVGDDTDTLLAQAGRGGQKGGGGQRGGGGHQGGGRPGGGSNPGRGNAGGGHAASSRGNAGSGFSGRGTIHAPSMNGPRLGGVLVVDDNVDTVLGFSLLLKAQGHDVRTAYNGPDAVETAAEFHPQVVMLDIGLPGLNGYEVAKQIRDQPEGEKIMLIALTGYGQDSDRRTSSDAGFDHHLVKPARFEQLLQILATVKVGK